MHVIVTGAAGFVGEALVAQLLLDASITRVSAVDHRFGPAADAWRADPRVRLHEADFAVPALLDAVLATPADRVFHLASVPGSLAEREPELGQRVNLQATLALFNRLAAGGRPARLVFASSIAVYGALDPGEALHEATPPAPTLSYGAHKLMAEVQLADLSRRGLLDGVSLRLPGIVARPISATGHGSAFMSDLIRHAAAGTPYDCPVSAQARCWWMSRRCCVRNLLHAATLDTRRLPPQRVVQLPVIAATVLEVATAAGRQPQVRFQPNDALEALFGRMPGLNTPLARELGFVDDGSLHELAQHALA
ncbi:MAG TPA: NAD-dependent epimerase/dehydratase family protein [Burkholderiaceae bacterium]